MHERVLSWAPRNSPEYELPLSMPPQVMVSTDAGCLWKARDAPVRKKFDELVGNIQRQASLNFVIFEVDSGTGNKRFLAYLLLFQRALGLIVFWVWCAQHLGHAIQGTVLTWLPGGMEVINAFYSGTLFLT